MPTIRILAILILISVGSASAVTVSLRGNESQSSTFKTEIGEQFTVDIFVEPEYRSQKIGKKLLNEIKEISKANGWNLVRWQTDEDNFTAKKLYDKVATKTKKNVYELKS